MKNISRWSVSGIRFWGGFQFLALVDSHGVLTNQTSQLEDEIKRENEIIVDANKTTKNLNNELEKLKFAYCFLYLILKLFYIL